jgi:hypothetical protein
MRLVQAADPKIGVDRALSTKVGAEPFPELWRVMLEGLASCFETKRSAKE